MKVCQHFFVVLLVSITSTCVYASVPCTDALKSDIKPDSLLRLLDKPEVDAAEVRSLINNSAVDINLQEVYFLDNALTTVVKRRDLHNAAEILSIILEDPELEVSAQNRRGYNALTLAMDQDRIDLAKLILAHPRNDLSIRRKGYGKFTPLQRAIYERKEDFVQLILEYIDMDAFNIRSRYGRSIMSFAKRYGNEKIIKMIEDFRKKNSRGLFKIKRLH